MNNIALSNARKMYDEIPDDITQDTHEAIRWAEDILMRKEGEGHIFSLTARENLVECSLCKPEWKADHTGEGMDTGSEAIVIATCEYLSGV